MQDFAALGPRASDRYQVPNAAIRPEQSLGVDTCLRAHLGALHTDVFVFALRYQDAIVLVPTAVNGARQNADGLGSVRSTNAPGARPRQRLLPGWLRGHRRAHAAHRLTRTPSVLPHSNAHWGSPSRSPRSLSAPQPCLACVPHVARRLPGRWT